ncbi:hypothetical protein Enr13x_12550 [Stieleria neptunia]|uniref:Uncharacterized protein n=1 Tax=Stieleria neptunia TaxID=2527979 RepID=A0A518HKN8_9BACT|nr:hypothetical protein [Stieleria neptunia]QDV41416.1 hypothetical protein Enr13x_12550 [Stieleria neptunia]
MSETRAPYRTRRATPPESIRVDVSLARIQPLIASGDITAAYLARRIHGAIVDTLADVAGSAVDGIPPDDVVVSVKPDDAGEAGEA